MLNKLFRCSRVDGQARTGKDILKQRSRTSHDE